MFFKIIGPIDEVETIATGSSIREIARLRKIYGTGRWRKLKGIATIQFSSGKLIRLRFTGMKLMALVRRNLRSSAF